MSIAHEIARRLTPRGSDGERYVWFYDNDVWSEAYEAARGRSAHPMNMWKAVGRALAKSALFRTDDHIRAASWSGRAIRHPRFVLQESQGAER